MAERSWEDEERNRLERLTPEEEKKLRILLRCLPENPEKMQEMVDSIGRISQASDGLVALSAHSDEILNAVDRTEMWRNVRTQVSTGAAWTARLIKDVVVIFAAASAIALFLIWAAQGFPGFQGIKVNVPEDSSQLPGQYFLP